jgi:hypothetical protein
VVNLTTIEQAAQENQNNDSAPKGSLANKGQHFKRKDSGDSVYRILVVLALTSQIEGINSTNKVLAQFQLDAGVRTFCRADVSLCRIRMYQEQREVWQ